MRRRRRLIARRRILRQICAECIDDNPGMTPGQLKAECCERYEQEFGFTLDPQTISMILTLILSLLELFSGDEDEAAASRAA